MELSACNSRYFNVTQEESYYSILPTTTAYARNAIFSGLLPSEMAKTNPDLWVGEDEDEGKNKFEEEFLAKQLRRNNLNIKMSYHKIKNLEEGRNLVDTVNNLFQNDLSDRVHFVTCSLMHVRHGNVRELALMNRLTDPSPNRGSSFAAYRYYAKDRRQGCKVVITTDHGTIRVKRS